MRKPSKQLTPINPKMGLVNTTIFPPKGFFFRQVELNWETTQEIAMSGLHGAARALQMVRANNPASGLNPSFAACLEDIKNYTCRRLNYDERWCGLPPAEIQTQEALKQAGRRSRKVAGCASCGKRRKP
jgi:hypothetical protein